jgi:hypothetical protein
MTIVVTTVKYVIVHFQEMRDVVYSSTFMEINFTKRRRLALLQMPYIHAVREITELVLEDSQTQSSTVLPRVMERFRRNAENHKEGTW